MRRALRFAVCLSIPAVAAAQDTPRAWFLRSWGDLLHLISTPFVTIGATSVTVRGLLQATLVILGALFVSRVLRRGLAGLRGRLPNLDLGMLYVLSRVVHYVVVFVALLLALGVIGVDLTKVAIVAGALGVGIGFGLQNIVNNFVSGLILLFERTIKVGDYIELPSGVTGEVRDINIRSTVVTTNDNVDVVVPNSELVSHSVTNWTLRDAIRRMHVPFGVAYGSNKETVRTAALEAAAQVEQTLKGPGRDPQVWLTGFGDSSLNFELIVWLTPEAVKRPSRMLAEYNWALETALVKHRIEIPFPQRDVHVRSLPDARGGLDKQIDRPDERTDSR